MEKADRPIGVFDSGVGGLTVAGAIRNILPGEQIIYFGDTAHLPYGDKSPDLIRSYSTKIVDFLLGYDCKTIVIACNTASAHAYTTVKQYVEQKAPSIEVINVIDPAIEHISKNMKLRRIGVIGTKGTIHSGMYAQKLIERRPDVEVVSQAAPLLVPMIEEGFIFDDISNAIIRSYLSQERLRNLDALILGCTHYPIIKNQIRKFYDFKTQVVDSSTIVATHLKEILLQKQLLRSDQHTGHRFFISDYTDYFKRIAEMFFDDEVQLDKVDLWS